MGNQEIIILLSILIVLASLFFIFGFIFLFKKRNSFKNQIEKQVVVDKKEPENLEEKFSNDVENTYLKKLEELANISQQDAIKLYVKEVEKKIDDEQARKIQEMKNKSALEISEMCSEVLLDAMEQMAEDIAKRATSYLTIDESLKGKLIGKEGRNIKVFEKVTGVDLLIEKDEVVSISCFNPVRRALAFNLLKRLVKSKSIEPSKIERYYEEEKNSFDKAMIEMGRSAVEDILQIEKYIPQSLYLNIGKLYYRTSYTQNILTHSIECAKLAAVIARHMGFDETKAKASAFIHDIGKSHDFEENNDHVQTGYDLAVKNHLKDFLINSIMSHHENVPINSVYSAITKIVDTLSSSRPGARKMSQAEFEKRMKTLEVLAIEIKGVDKVYAIRSGKEIRVLVNEDLADFKINEIAEILRKKYESNELCSIRPIDIVVIKEKRARVKTKSKNFKGQ